MSRKVELETEMVQAGKRIQTLEDDLKNVAKIGGKELRLWQVDCPVKSWLRVLSVNECQALST